MTSGGPFAVRFGRPMYYWRSCKLYAFGMSIALVSSIIIIPLAFSGLAIKKISVVDVPAGAIMMGVQGIGILIGGFGVYPTLKATRRLRKNPDMCLNCGYQLEPGARACHECGRAQNREDLSARWAALLAPSE